MLNDYTNYLKAVKAASLSMDIIESKLEAAKKELFSALRQFRAYSKKNLKEAEKAMILTCDGARSNGSYLIKGTSITVSIEQSTGEIILYSYDRKNYNYFSLPIQQIKTGAACSGASVWNDILTADEKEAINRLINFISV